MPKEPFSEPFNRLPESIKAVIRFIVDQVQPESVILFGSRARGDHRENSDFDLAVKAAHLNPAQWARVQVELSEEPFTLFSIDLVHFEKMNPAYQKNISTEGKILYAK